MICLAVAVINHRQPEGTASTHGKESGVARQSTHRAVYVWAPVHVLCANVYCVRVCGCVYEKCGHERMDLWKEMSALYYPPVLEQYSLCAGLAVCLCVSVWGYEINKLQQRVELLVSCFLRYMVLFEEKQRKWFPVKYSHHAVGFIKSGRCLCSRHVCRECEKGCTASEIEIWISGGIDDVVHMLVYFWKSWWSWMQLTIRVIIEALFYKHQILILFVLDSIGATRKQHI